MLDKDGTEIARVNENVAAAAQIATLFAYAPMLVSVAFALANAIDNADQTADPEFKKVHDVEVAELTRLLRRKALLMVNAMAAVRAE